MNKDEIEECKRKILDPQNKITTTQLMESRNKLVNILKEEIKITPSYLKKDLLNKQICQINKETDETVACYIVSLWLISGKPMPY